MQKLFLKRAIAVCLLAGIWNVAASHAAAPNLVQNGDFSSIENETTPTEAQTKTGMPYWRTWQDDASHGTFSRDAEKGSGAPGSARIAGASEGTWFQWISCKPGEIYSVSVKHRRQGKGSATVLIRWKTPEAQWIGHEMDKELTATTLAGAEWSESKGEVKVPSVAGQLYVLLLVNGQLTAEDVAWFDDVVIKRVEE